MASPADGFGGLRELSLTHLPVSLSAPWQQLNAVWQSMLRLWDVVCECLVVAPNLGKASAPGGASSVHPGLQRRAFCRLAP